MGFAKVNKKPLKSTITGRGAGAGAGAGGCESWRSGNDRTSKCEHEWRQEALPKKSSRTGGKRRGRGRRGRREKQEVKREERKC